MHTLPNLKPPPVSLRRVRLRRWVLIPAAFYNFLFCLWTFFQPEAFFTIMEIEPPLYPALWQCIGMVVGVFGLGYAYAAWRPEHGMSWVALGLFGKVLGPIGWVMTVVAGDWPARTVVLIVFNDLMWWIPFALVLLSYRSGRSSESQSLSQSR